MIFIYLYCQREGIQPKNKLLNHVANPMTMSFCHSFKKLLSVLKLALPLEAGLNATKTKIGFLFIFTLLQMPRELKRGNGCSNAAPHPPPPPYGWRLFIEDYGEWGGMEGWRVGGYRGEELTLPSPPPYSYYWGLFW
jgi:hypothetical protein